MGTSAPEAVHNAIVWQDTRTQRSSTGSPRRGRREVQGHGRLPLATYFAGPKGDLDPRERRGRQGGRGGRAPALRHRRHVGPVNLTGGAENDGVHVRRHQRQPHDLMDLSSLTWDESIAADMGIPLSMLPEIKSSSEVYASAVPASSTAPPSRASSATSSRHLRPGLPVQGEAKNTYGTGNFMLLNTGEEQVPSENGLLTTVCYKLGDKPTIYALEGSIAVTGSLVQWVPRQPRPHRRGPRDRDARRERGRQRRRLLRPRVLRPVRPALASRRPRRRPRRPHPLRQQGPHRPAVLEATAFQSREVIDAMNADSGVPLTELRVDGGMVANELLMHAVPGRPARVDVVRRRSPRRRPSGRRTPRVSPWVLGERGGHPHQLGRGQAVDAAECRRRSASVSTATGRRPSPRRWTGWTRTSTDVAPPLNGARTPCVTAAPPPTAEPAPPGGPPMPDPVALETRLPLALPGRPPPPTPSTCSSSAAG